MFNVLCKSPLRRLSSIFLASAVALSSASALAQSAALAALRPVSQANRVPASPDFGPKTQLTGHLPGWVSSGAQISKSVDTSETLHLTLVLQRDANVQAAFEKLLADQQNSSSPFYHQWLTPVQVGQLFGPTDSDIAAVTSWLSSQGLTVDLVSNSKLMIDAHGSTATVSNAFRISFGFYELNGTAHLSAVSEPSVPTALAPVVKYIYGLTEVPLRPLNVTSAPHRSDAVAVTSSTAKPDLTTSGGNHYLTPGDFAIIYDVNSVYTGGNKGASLGSGLNHVAIIGRSRVAATDISEWAANVGVTSYNLNTIIPTTGTDPGATCTTANANTCTTGGDQGEQTLDVDRVIGTAPGVQADLVVSLSSRTTDGVYISAAYNVNTTVDKVMTISYGSCEANNGASGVSLWDTLFSTGVSEGISTFVSSGDSAANGCATSFTATTTARTVSINAICSSTYATCVGGTEFADTANPSTYWASYVSGGNNFTSALSYIPEGAWNEPEAGGTAASTDCSGGTYCPSGTGGGVSTYIAKPTWQTGTGVPADGFRDVPDVSYPAASHDGYYACLDYALGPYITSGQIPSGSNCTSGYFFSFSGTSAAAPAMAGVAALLNTAAGKAQGNLNPTLYSIANGSSGSTAFHDITVASSAVSGCVITTPSMCNNSTPGSSANSTTAAGGLQGYLLTTGYDQATGLGSIDVAKFLAAAVATPPASFTVTPASTSVSALAGIASTDSITLASVNAFAGSVALTCTVTSGTATGTCSLAPTSSTLTSGGTGSSTLSITPSTVGTFTVTVTGTSGTTVVTSSTITVTSGAPFSLKATSASLSGVSGTASTDVITATSTAPFAGSVTFSCAVSPSTSGTCSLTPTSATVASGGTGTSTLSVTPSGIGTFTVTVTGTSGSQTASTTVSVTSVGPYTVTPASASVAAVVGTASTDGITLTSTAPFAGAVALTCTVTAGTGNGTCSLTPTSATLTSGGTGTSTLSVTPSSTGTFTVTVTGTSGTSTVTSSVITVTAVAPFSLSAASTSVSAKATVAATDAITVTSTAPFAGAVALSCSVTPSTSGTCSLLPASATVTAGGTGTSTLTVTPSVVGSLTVTVTGTSGATTVTTTVTVTSALPYSLAASPASLAFASGATQGNTSTITLTPGGYTGIVTLSSCALTTNSGSPYYPPTCTVSSTSVSSASPTAVITISSTTAVTQSDKKLETAGFASSWRFGALLLAFGMLLLPIGRRNGLRALRILPLLAILGLGATMISGCGGGGSPAPTPVTHSSAGSYTATVSSTSSLSATPVPVTVTVTIN